MPDPGEEPLTQSDEYAAMKQALTAANALLEAYAGDGHNVELDVMRWQRFHHAALTAAGVVPSVE